MHTQTGVIDAQTVELTCIGRVLELREKSRKVGALLQPVKDKRPKVLWAFNEGRD